ncbi:MAG TPA: carboxypeptidase-like regulatory domain-containing protein, partial [Planctomycetaceae bacterium]
MSRSSSARGYLSSARWLVGTCVIATCLVAAGAAAADEKWVISGKVTDADGRAVPGSVVRSVDFEQRRAEAVSGDDGKFQLTVPAEARSVSLTVMDAAQTQLWVGLFYRGASEKQGEVAAILGPSREVTVEVVDGGDKPVDGATVLATEQFVDLALVKTGKDGLATVRLPSKTNVCTIYALKSGAGYDYFSNDRRDDSNYPLKDKVEAPPRVKLKLNGSRTARVQAVDSRGQPLAGVIVRPWSVNRVGNPGQTNFSSCNIFQSETGSDGFASFDWLPTDVQYGVTFMSHSREFSTPNNLTVKANDPRTDFQLRFLRQTKLAGRVLGPDGNPAAGVAVRAVGAGVSATGEHPGTRGQGAATTGADGRFEMDVYPEQAYILAVVHERWAAHRIGVIVREGKPVTDVELKLAEGIVVRGRITRGPDKSPVAETYVNLQLEGGRIPDEIEKLRHPNDKYWHGMSMSFHTQSDKEGNFRFVAAPGEYSLIGPPHADPV